MTGIYHPVSDECHVVGRPRERVPGGLAQRLRQLSRGATPEEPRNLANPLVRVGRHPKGAAVTRLARKKTLVLFNSK